MKKTWVAVISVVIGAVVLGGGIYHWWTHRPLPMPKTVDEAVTAMTTDRYQRMPEEQRKRYVDRMVELSKGMTEDERKALSEKIQERAKNDPQFKEAMKPVQEDMMMAQVRAYAKMTPEERTKAIDKMIDMMEGMKAMQGMARKPAAAGKPDAPVDEAAKKAEQEKRQAEATKRIRDWLTKGNPQEQGYMAEFFKALINRRVERGLEPMPFPAPRGK